MIFSVDDRLLVVPEEPPRSPEGIPIQRVPADLAVVAHEAGLHLTRPADDQPLSAFCRNPRCVTFRRFPGRPHYHSDGRAFVMRSIVWEYDESPS